MPFFHNQSRTDLRQLYVTAWRKHRERLPQEPVEAQIAAVIEVHPEYHTLLDDPSRALDRDYRPEDGMTNPFLHMGLHLAVRDQVATDRPPGIRQVFERLTARLGEPHAAEHVCIEALGEALWQAQRSGLPPDERAYLERLHERAGV